MNNINEQSYADVLSIDRIRNDPLQIRTQVGQITQGNQSTTDVTQLFHHSSSISVLNIGPGGVGGRGGVAFRVLINIKCFESRLVSYKQIFVIYCMQTLAICANLKFCSD